MKFILIILMAIVAVTQEGSAAAQSVDALVQRLQTTMLETEVAYHPIKEEIATATPEQRKRLLAAVLRITEEALKEPQPRSAANSKFISVSAAVLWAVSDDNATLAAFGSHLTQVGLNLEPDVIRALSACRDPKAVEAMADFTRVRLKETKELVPRLPTLASGTYKERRAADDMFISLLVGLKGLARSANSSGKSVARELREEFAKLFDGSPYRESIVQGLATELDPLLCDSRRPLPARTAASRPAPKVTSKQLQQSKSEKPTTVTTSEQKQSSGSVVTWIAGALAVFVLFGVLIWFLRKM